jgi:hypothetical protein
VAFLLVSMVSFKCIEKAQTRKRKMTELRMPFKFPGEKVPSEDPSPPQRSNHIDDIVEQGKTGISITDISGRNTSCRDASERNGLMVSSAIGTSDIDFEI